MAYVFPSEKCLQYKMMNEKLLKKFLSGECSFEDLKELEEYWNGEDHKEIDQLLQTYWEESNEVEEKVDPLIKKRIWAALPTATKPHLEVKKSNPLRIKYLSKWSVAASIAILLVSATLISLFINNYQSSIVEKFNNGAEPMLVKLSDGSQVWLNRNSSISYRRKFDSKERATTLEGEAYFDVKTDAERPFTVRTGNIQTRVLGTSFNLLSPMDGEKVEIALVEGSVQVNYPDTSIVLKPGEQLIYSKDTRRFNRIEFERGAPQAWKDKIIYFQKADVNEVANRLGNWYGVEVSVKEAHLIKGKLQHRYDTKKLSFDEVLEGISKVMDYTCKKQEDGTVLIQPSQ